MLAVSVARTRPPTRKEMPLLTERTVEVLNLLALPVQKYTYSRANSLTCPQRDASTQRGGGGGGWGFRAAEALNLLALLVKKYKY